MYLNLLIVITIDPTIANNNIIEVINNHIQYVVYMILPILMMSVLSNKLPSQSLDVTYDTCLISIVSSNSLLNSDIA